MAEDPKQNKTRDKPKRAKKARSGSLEGLRRERLRARIDELDQLLRFQRSMPMKDNKAAASAAGPEWYSHAEAARAAAQQSLDDGDLQVGWSNAHQAARFLYYGMDERERRAHERSLRREAEEKLKNWRKSAVLDILGEDEPQPTEPSVLSLARFLLDEHFDNQYFKLEAVAIRLRYLPILLGVLVATVLLLSAAFDWWPGLNLHTQHDFFLVDFSETLVVLFTGTLGATLSNVLSTLGLGGRIPVFLDGTRGWLLRPLIGALSAVLVATVIQSELLPLKADTQVALYGWALAAGFSDRLLNQVMRRVEQAAEK